MAARNWLEDSGLFLRYQSSGEEDVLEAATTTATVEILQG